MKYNEREWSPPAVVFLRHVTRAVEGTEPQVNALYCWAAERVIRSKKDDVTDWVITAHGRTGHELAAWLTESMMGVDTLWVYAHQLAVDLFATRLLDRLMARGWQLTGAFSVSDTGPFFRLTKSNKRLVITDSWSWLPHALTTIGEAVRLARPPARVDDKADQLLIDCQRDVVVLRTAICDLMDWWDREQLGNWTVTGTATGWNACRHRMRGERILITPEPAGRDHDHLAVYGGRRDAWRIGHFQSGPYVELDFADAHPTLVAHLAMPRKRGRLVTPGCRQDGPWVHDDRGFLAQAVVRTSTPRYPVRWEGGTWYPIGTFRTVLAGPELDLAARCGDLVDVGPGRWHLLGDALAPWGRWVTEVSAGNESDTPPVARLAAKAWGRTVIGKWSARTSRVIGKTDALYGPYHVSDGWTATIGSDIRMVTVGDTEWTMAKDQWSDSAYPAVWAWVESHLRARMAAVIDALPYAAIISCHTDGVLVDAKVVETQAVAGGLVPRDAGSGITAMEAWAKAMSEKTWPLVLRVKHVFEEVNVFGPAHMEVDRRRRWSGVPVAAEVVGPLAFRSRQTPKLTWQMSHYTGQGYLRPTVTVRPTGPFVHRWITGDSRPAPIVMDYDEAHGNTVLPWATSYSDSEQYELDPNQHPHLLELVR